MSFFFIFVGLFAALVGFIVRKAGAGSNKGSAGVALFSIGLTVAALAFVFGLVVVVESGEVGVKKLFGKVDNEVLTEGLHFVNPLADIVTYDVKTQNYTMSSAHTEGDNEGDDAIRVLTADGLEVIIDLTVLYRVMPPEAPRILREIGPDYKGVIVRPISRTKIRDNAVYYDAISLYSTKRDEFQARIFKTISDDFAARGLQLEQLLVRNITLPASVKATIESKINAEQEAQKMEFVLQKERQEAERKRVEAQGRADAQRILGSSLNDRLLQYEQIQAQKELAQSPNAKVIIMNGRGAPVILNPN